MPAEPTRIQRGGARDAVLVIPSSSRFRDDGAALPDPDRLTGKELSDELRHGSHRYALKQFLGRGASSSVYAAIQLATNVPYAIKLLSDQADAFTRELFKREADLLCRLKLKHIVRGLDRGQFRGRPYVVLPKTSEFLLDVLDGERACGTLPRYDWLIEYVANVLEALEQLHGAGLVHRDLKPANLTAGDTIRVVDLGVACNLRDPADPFNRLVVGTPAYMAPEQLDGRATIHSDLYAVGVILFELLTGRTPSAARDLATRAAEPNIAHDPRELEPATPEGLAQLCVRLLSPIPSCRGTSALTVMLELNEVGRILSKGAAPPPLPAVVAPKTLPFIAYAANRTAKCYGAIACMIAWIALFFAELWIPSLLAMIGVLYCMAGLGEQLRITKDRLLVRSQQAIAPWAALIAVNTTSSSQELELVIRMNKPKGGTAPKNFEFPRLDRPVEDIVAAIQAVSPHRTTRFNRRDRLPSVPPPRRLPAAVLQLPEAREAAESTAVRLPAATLDTVTHPAAD